MDRVLRKTLKNGKFENVDDVVSRRMRAIRAKGTRPEKVLKSIVRSIVPKGRKVYFNYSMLGKPDVFIPAAKLAIFCDGCFFHGCQKHGHLPRVNNAYWAKKIELNVKRDLRIRQALRKKGYHVWRIWEHQLSNWDSCRQLRRNLAKRLPLINILT